MEITLTTPALLFPALSLLLLAYTNRSLALTGRVRGLKARYESAPTAYLVPQIRNLRRRLVLCGMQVVGTANTFGCVLTMCRVCGPAMAEATLVSACWRC